MPVWRPTRQTNAGRRTSQTSRLCDEGRLIHRGASCKRLSPMPGAQPCGRLCPGCFPKTGRCTGFSHCLCSKCCLASPEASRVPTGHTERVPARDRLDGIAVQVVQPCQQKVNQKLKFQPFPKATAQHLSPTPSHTPKEKARKGSPPSFPPLAGALLELLPPGQAYWGRGEVIVVALPLDEELRLPCHGIKGAHSKGTHFWLGPSPTKHHPARFCLWLISQPLGGRKTSSRQCFISVG